MFAKLVLFHRKLCDPRELISIFIYVMTDSIRPSANLYGG
nr:MAG TPA: hypothetical protein [Caudoviricetes sp.]